MLKERELGELVRGSETSQTRVDYVGAEKRAAAEHARLATVGVQGAAELAALERRLSQGETLPSADESRRQALLASAVRWRDDYQRWLAGLGALFAAPAQAGQKDQADTRATRLQANIAEDPGALGLHFVVAEDQIGIIVATPQGSFGRFSPVTREALNRQVGALRQALRERSDTRPAAQALWDMLIAPIQADLTAARATTLVLSLTDTLRYIPFAALQDPQGRYLMQDYALSLWAAAAPDVDVRAAQSAWQVAGMGLSQAREGFSALPGVRSELQSIVRTSASPLGVLPGNIAIDENFGRAQFEAALRGQTNVVHVASHFDFRPGDEHRSMLLVGAGEPVSLAQLAVMNFARVEQLTLSACNTATGGGVNENGAEVEGLAAAVLKKRARSVLASLWAVADDSTAQLMQRFYAQRAQAQPTSRAQALRQAQLALLEGTAATATNTATSNQRQALRLGGVQGQALPVDPTKPFAHPYFWAPFVISGSWL